MKSKICVIPPYAIFSRLLNNNTIINNNNNSFKTQQSIEYSNGHFKNHAIASSLKEQIFALECSGYFSILPYFFLITVCYCSILPTEKI
jgi:hypothetical protein